MGEELNSFLEEEIKTLKDKHLFRTMDMLGGRQGPRVRLNGREVIMLSSNNYLGLATHPRVIESARKAEEAYGCGTGAARSLSGNLPVHEELETEIARFKNVESALLFNSGYTANVGTIASLMIRGDVIFSDELNHGSIIDGCRLSRAENKVYRHNDIKHLESLLSESHEFKKRMIVTDTVFSMEGDIAPLKDIVLLARKYNAFVMVDEAHATGVLGKHGRGAVEMFGLEGKVEILMGTLGKALGCLGGYIAGSRNLIEFLSHKARSFLFTTSLPPSIAASALEAIHVLQDEPSIRERLWANTKIWKDGLTTLGFNTLKSQTPIIPIFIGDTAIATEMSRRLFDKGVYVHKIGTPYVPEGSARLRTIISSSHTEENLSEALSAFEKVGKELRII